MSKQKEYTRVQLEALDSACRAESALRACLYNLQELGLAEDVHLLITVIEGDFLI